MIIKSDYRIASEIDGYGLVLRNKHLSDADHQLPDNSVLFVHGATYGSTDTFDYAVDGESWMDRMAAEGFDTWCLDLLGYGLSDRPVEMSQPAVDNPPIVDTAHAVAEVNHAVDFILKDRGCGQLNLIGYSWGTAICGSYAGLYADKVKRLVLSGAIWVEEGQVSRAVDVEIGAYRTVEVESMMKRWATGLTDSELDLIVAESVRRKWCEDVAACDPDFASSGVLRAPAGVVKDFMHCSASGQPWYDPSKILAPVQIVVGEQDVETTPEQGLKVFSQLTSAAEKRMTVIGQGTHTLLLENNRHALLDVVSGFLRPSVL